MTAIATQETVVVRGTAGPLGKRTMIGREIVIETGLILVDQAHIEIAVTAETRIKAMRSKTAARLPVHLIMNLVVPRTLTVIAVRVNMSEIEAHLGNRKIQVHCKCPND